MFLQLSMFFVLLNLYIFFSFYRCWRVRFYNTFHCFRKSWRQSRLLFVPEMAEDFDVEAMLEAPYKKGVSYVCNVGIMMALMQDYWCSCRFIFCSKCCEFFCDEFCIYVTPGMVLQTWLKLRYMLGKKY